MQNQYFNHIISVKKPGLASFSTDLNEINRYFFLLLTSFVQILGRKTVAEMCFLKKKKKNLVTAPRSRKPTLQVLYAQQ